MEFFIFSSFLTILPALANSVISLSVIKSKYWEEKCWLLSFPLISFPGHSPGLLIKPQPYSSEIHNHQDPCPFTPFSLTKKCLHVPGLPLPSLFSTYILPPAIRVTALKEYSSTQKPSENPSNSQNEVQIPQHSLQPLPWSDLNLLLSCPLNMDYFMLPNIPETHQWLHFNSP